MRISDWSSDVCSSDLHEMIDGLVTRFMPEKSYPEQWDTKGLHEECRRLLGIDLPVDDWAKEEGIDDAAIRERVIQASDRKMAETAANFGPEIMQIGRASGRERVWQYV